MEGVDMSVIFPLSVGGRVVLVLIALILGLICWMMWAPQHWKWLFASLKKGGGEKVLKEEKKGP